MSKFYKWRENLKTKPFSWGLLKTKKMNSEVGAEKFSASEFFSIALYNFDIQILHDW